MKTKGKASVGWWIYFVRCRGGEVYTGVCTDVARRFAEHVSGGARAARFLRGRGPLSLLASYPVGDRSRALSLEARIKRLRRRDKLALIADWSDDALATLIGTGK